MYKALSINPLPKYFDLPDFAYHKDDIKEMDRDTQTGQGGTKLPSCALSPDKRSSVAHHNEPV